MWSRISALRKITKTYYAYLGQKLTYRMSLKILGGIFLGYYQGSIYKRNVN